MLLARRKDMQQLFTLLHIESQHATSMPRFLECEVFPEW